MINFKLLLLTLILFLTKIVVFSQCAGCTFTIAGNDAGAYILNAGDVMCISSTGNFTGTVTLAGGILCNEGIFNGNTNNNSGSLIENYGTMSIGGVFFFAGFTINNHNGGVFNYSGGGFSGATLSNDGQFNYTGSLSVSNTTINNTGNISVSGTFATSGNFVNDGTLTVGTTYRLNTIGSMTNNGTINANVVEINDDLINSSTINTTTSFIINGGVTTNDGIIDSQGTFIHNNGILNNDQFIHVTTTFTNNQTLNNTNLITVDGQFTNNSSLTNSGCIDAKSNFVNNNPLTNNATLKIAGNFVNNNLVNNNLYIGVTGNFRNDGSQFLGTAIAPHARLDIGGLSTNNSTLGGFLDFNDISTPGGIDVNFGTINANVAFGTANSGGISILPCTFVILPVELLSFDAKIKDDFVMVSWATVSETNNDFFTVQHSKKGINWGEVTKVKGLENSLSIKYYQVIDKEPYFGVSYYRLKQTDFDGLISYSKIKEIKMNPYSSQGIKIYPNPAKEILTIEGNLLEIKKFRVYNSAGQDITSKIRIIQKREFSYTVDISTLPTGIYILKTVTKSLKFDKQ